MKIRPAKSINGQITLPGDKSISHRAAMIAAIADGETRIENFATSSDCGSTLDCIAKLGVEVRRDDNTVIVNGAGKSGFLRPNAPLDCGNSGTTMRLLSGILAGQDFESTLIGDESLQRRPMKRIIDPLTRMGSAIRSENGNAPLVISGKYPLDAIEYQPPVASAQIKSCVLLAGLHSNGITTVIESVKTRDHTERMLGWFGAEVSIKTGEKASHISVSGDTKLTARDLVVPSDISSAAYFLVAAACLDGSDITLPNIGLNPSRRGILDVLLELGASIETSALTENSNEPVATLRILGGLTSSRKATPVLQDDLIANLIDEIPILAILATQLDTGLEIRGAAELRVKESDRIAAVVTNLKLMGADITEFPDGFRVRRSRLTGAVLESFGDHRIAMAFTVAGLLAEGETEIINAECADISFPQFFEILESVVR